MNLITDKIPVPTKAKIDKAIDDAMQYFASNGVTSVHHVAYPTDAKRYLEDFQRAYEQNRLITRIYDIGWLADWEERVAFVQENGIGDHWLRVAGVKAVFDGALGSHTAAFFDPFSDAPGDRGLFMIPQKELHELAAKANQAGLQLVIHAIGDRANHELLNIYEELSRGGDRRFRIEHAQHLDAKDFKRFAELNIIASMQPYHAIDDGRWAEEVIGPERIKTTYAFKSLLDAGAVVAFGSDWPVAPASPLEGIYAAVTRRTLDGENPGGWVPEQKISVAQALRAYTYNGAFASLEEDIKGTLEPGKLADFVILSRDITRIDPVAIKDVQILATYVGGQKVYDAQKK